MSFARIASFQFKPGTFDEATRMARATLVPLLQKEPGFLSYCILKGENDRGVSIAEYQTRAQAESAYKKALDWTKENQSELLASEDVFVGEDVLDVEGGNIALVEALHDAFNQKDLDRMGRLMDGSAKVSAIPIDKSFPWKDYVRDLFTAFPDMKFESVRYSSDGDLVLVEYICRGTHTGPFQSYAEMGPIAPTHRKIELRGVEAFTLRDGKITGVRLHYDRGMTLKQLGVEGVSIPAAAKGAGARPEVRH